MERSLRSKRSGISTATRELIRGEPTERTVRPIAVVVLSPGRGVGHERDARCQTLPCSIAHPAVDCENSQRIRSARDCRARCTAWRHRGAPASLESPWPRIRDRCRSELLPDTVHHKQLCQTVDHVLAGHRPRNIQRNAATRVLINDRKPLQRLAAGSAIEDEIPAPNMIGTPCSKPRTCVLRFPSRSPFLRFSPHFQSLSPLHRSWFCVHNEHCSERSQLHGRPDAQTRRISVATA